MRIDALLMPFARAPHDCAADGCPPSAGRACDAEDRRIRRSLLALSGLALLVPERRAAASSGPAVAVDERPVNPAVPVLGTVHARRLLQVWGGHPLAAEDLIDDPAGLPPAIATRRAELLSGGTVLDLATRRPLLALLAPYARGATAYFGATALFAVLLDITGALATEGAPARLRLPAPVPGALADDAAFPSRPLTLAADPALTRRVEAVRRQGPVYAHAYFAPAGASEDGRPAVLLAGLRLADGEGEALAGYRLRPDLAVDGLLAGEWRSSRLPLTAHIAYPAIA